MISIGVSFTSLLLKALRAPEGVSGFVIEMTNVSCQSIDCTYECQMCYYAVFFHSLTCWWEFLLTVHVFVESFSLCLVWILCGRQKTFLCLAYLSLNTSKHQTVMLTIRKECIIMTPSPECFKQQKYQGH